MDFLQMWNGKKNKEIFNIGEYERLKKQNEKKNNEIFNTGENWETEIRKTFFHNQRFKKQHQK